MVVNNVDVKPDIAQVEKAIDDVLCHSMDSEMVPELIDEDSIEVN